jgi:hypothetical protein
VIFEPEDNCANALFSSFVDLLRLLADVMAAMFVLITITNSFLELPLAGRFISRHPCRVAEFKTGFRRFPDWLFVAANRQSLTRHRSYRMAAGKTLAAGKHHGSGEK